MMQSGPPARQVEVLGTQRSAGVQPEELPWLWSGGGWREEHPARKSG